MRKHVPIAGLASLAAVTIGLAGAGVAQAAPPSVSVRVEGLKKTLLASTTIRSRMGNVKRDGHLVIYRTALGALQLASAGKWKGTWDSGLAEWELSGVLGESHPLTSKYFWAVYVNNRQASSGAGEVALRNGQQIVFAALPDSDYDEDLIGITAPATATKGSMISVKVVYYDAKGRAHALAGATVTLDGSSVKTGSSGQAQLSAGAAGKQTITASKAKFVRDETDVSVS